MSFASDDTVAQDDPTKKKAEEDPSTAGASGVFGSTPTAEANSNGAAVGGALAPRAGASGQWTNLQSYLDANQDQAADMSGKVAGHVSDEAESANSALGATKDSFLGAVDQNTIKGDDNLFNTVASDPTSVANDADKTAAFQHIYNGTYGGPTDITKDANWSGITSSIGKAQEDVDRTKSEAGRKGLLFDTYNRPDYTQGEQGLDQMLLQRSSAGQQAFANIANKYNGIGGNLDTTAQQALEAAKQAQATSQQSSQKARDTLTGAANAFGTTVSPQAAAMTAKAQQDAENIKAQLLAVQGGGAVKTDPAYDSQIADIVGKNLYGYDPTQFVHLNNVGPTSGQALTPEQAAALQAFNKLAGGGGNEAVDSVYGKYAGGAGAGTWNGYTVDNNKDHAVDQAINAQKSQYLSDLQDYVQHYQDAAAKAKATGLQFVHDAGFYDGASRTNAMTEAADALQLEATRAQHALDVARGAADATNQSDVLSAYTGWGGNPYDKYAGPIHLEGGDTHAVADFTPTASKYDTFAALLQHYGFTAPHAKDPVTVPGAAPRSITLPTVQTPPPAPAQSGPAVQQVQTNPMPGQTAPTPDGSGEWPGYTWVWTEPTPGLPPEENKTLVPTDQVLPTSLPPSAVGPLPSRAVDTVGVDQSAERTPDALLQFPSIMSAIQDPTPPSRVFRNVG